MKDTRRISLLIIFITFYVAISIYLESVGNGSWPFLNSYILLSLFILFIFNLHKIKYGNIINLFITFFIFINYLLNYLFYYLTVQEMQLNLPVSFFMNMLILIWILSEKIKSGISNKKIIATEIAVSIVLSFIIFYIGNAFDFIQRYSHVPMEISYYTYWSVMLYNITLCFLISYLFVSIPRISQNFTLLSSCGIFIWFITDFLFKTSNLVYHSPIVYSVSSTAGIGIYISSYILFYGDKSRNNKRIFIPYKSDRFINPIIFIFMFAIVIMFVKFYNIDNESKITNFSVFMILGFLFMVLNIISNINSHKKIRISESIPLDIPDIIQNKIQDIINITSIEPILSDIEKLSEEKSITYEDELIFNRLYKYRNSLIDAFRLLTKSLEKSIYIDAVKDVSHDAIAILRNAESEFSKIKDCHDKEIIQNKVNDLYRYFNISYRNISNIFKYGLDQTCNEDDIIEINKTIKDNVLMVFASEERMVNLNLDMTNEIYLKSDETLLNRILFNIISNAEKESKIRDGKIFIKTRIWCGLIIIEINNTNAFLRQEILDFAKSSGVSSLLPKSSNDSRRAPRGLSIIHICVSKTRGYLTISSKKNIEYPKGITSFRLFFPLDNIE